MTGKVLIMDERDTGSAIGRRLAEALKTERERRDLTQAEVAAIVGTSQPNYARWELAKSRPQDHHHLRKLAEFLGVRLIDVLTLAYVPDVEPPTQAQERRIEELEERVALVPEEVRAQAEEAIRRVLDELREERAELEGHDNPQPIAADRLLSMEEKMRQLGFSNGQLANKLDDLTEDAGRKVDGLNERLNALEGKCDEIVAHQKEILQLVRRLDRRVDS